MLSSLSLSFINLVARKCYYQLRQLRMVSRSLTHQSTLTLVHAFVTSRYKRSLTPAVLCWLGSPWHLGPNAAFSCSPCWKTAQVFLCHCLHARCTILATISQRIQYRITAIVSRPGVSFAAPPLTFVTSAAQCRFWQRVGCCVLLRGVSFWSLTVQRRAFSVVGT